MARVVAYHNVAHMEQEQHQLQKVEALARTGLQIQVDAIVLIVMKSFNLHVSVIGDKKAENISLGQMVKYFHGFV